MGARQRWALQQLQQGSDPSPVHHPLQALARALQGAIGGYTVYNADQEDKAAGAAMFNSLPGIGGAPQAAQPPAAAPGGSAMPSPMAAPQTSPMSPAPDPSAPRGIRNNNPGNIEDGPFARKMPGYAGSDGRFAKFGSPENGMTAMDSLLASYGSRGINTVGGVINRWAPPTDNNPTSAYASTVAKGMGVDPTAPIDMSDPATRQKLALLIGKFENGKPVQMASMGGGMPPGGAPPAAQASAAGPVAPPGPQMAQNGVPGAQPPQALNAPVPNRSSVQIPPDVQATIQRLGADPRTRPQALQLYMQYAKPVESIQPMTPEQRKQWNVPEGMSAGIDTVTGKPTFSPPQTNVNLNTAQKGQEVMATESAQDFKAAQAAGREATKRAGVWDSMEQASKGFTPGATAEIKLQARRYLKDLGVIEGADVPDAEVFRQMQQQLAIHSQPKGQGAVSNFERDMYAKSIANMTMSPEALTRAIDMGRKLDAFDRKVAEIYRNNARKNGGVPNSIDINEEIDKLGAPLSQSELNYLRRTGEGKSGAGGGTTGGAAPDLKKKYGLD